MYDSDADLMGKVKRFECSGSAVQEVNMGIVEHVPGRIRCDRTRGSPTQECRVIK